MSYVVHEALPAEESAQRFYVGYYDLGGPIESPYTGTRVYPFVRINAFASMEQATEYCRYLNGGYTPGYEKTMLRSLKLALNLLAIIAFAIIIMPIVLTVQVSP